MGRFVIVAYRPKPGTNAGSTRCVARTPVASSPTKGS